MYVVAQFKGGPLDGRDDYAVRPEQNVITTIQLVDLKTGAAIGHRYVRKAEFVGITEGKVPFEYAGSISADDARVG